MTFEQFRLLVRDGRLPTLMLLHGDESYFIDQAVRLVVDAVVPPDTRDFNLTSLYGRELRGAELIDQARTLPVFSSQRLVLIRNVQEAAADQLERFADYLEDPVPETVLLVTASSIDKRRKFFQKFAKVGEVIEFRRLYENQLPQFVKEHARTYGRTLTGAALKLFCQRVGTNLAEVVGELDKLVSYAGNREFLEEDDVAAVVSDTRSESIFTLIDAIGAGDRVAALRLLDRLLADGQPALVILTMLGRHFRQIWKARELLAQQVPQKDLPRLIGVNPYFLNGILAQARRYSDAELRAIFPRLLAVDQALKSGGEARAHLEGLVLMLENSGGRQGSNAGRPPGRSPGVD